jgi:preprotein translocase subunit SecE
MVNLNMPSPMLPDFKGTPLTFFKEVKSELLKVVWPTKDEVIKLTTIVIAVSLAVGLYIGGLDILMAKVMDLLVKR